MIKAKTLFLLDGIGAILSALFLGFVLVELNSLIGIPVKSLHLLASFPILFAVFDFYSFFSSSTNPTLKLRIIATANSCYCLLSLSLVFYHFDTMTLLGWLYFLLEILVIGILVKAELNTAKKLKST